MMMCFDLYLSVWPGIFFSITKTIGIILKSPQGTACPNNQCLTDSELISLSSASDL